MTGVELAARLGVSEATVSRIASGERQPSVELMVEIRNALGWSIERQLDARFQGTYPSEFKQRMERRRAGAAA
jgi:transcriptional regulator with XRE-family HTH domain